MDAFRQGYKDYVKNLPLDLDNLSIGEQHMYEQGRLFGVYCETQGVSNPYNNWQFHVNQARAMGYFK
jgi:hypothetical protein